jgi:hypothetical protein
MELSAVSLCWSFKAHISLFVWLYCHERLWSLLAVKSLPASFWRLQSIIILNLISEFLSLIAYDLSSATSAIFNSNLWFRSCLIIFLLALDLMNSALHETLLGSEVV